MRGTAVWSSVPLFLYLLVQLLVLFASPSSNLGSIKFVPTIYFSAALIVAPFVFTFFVVLLFFGDEELAKHRYARMMWGVWRFVLVSTMVWIVVASFAIRHLVLYGDDRGDLVTFDAAAESYSIVNNLAGNTTWLTMFATLKLVFGFVLKAFDTRTIQYQYEHGTMQGSVI